MASRLALGARRSTAVAMVFALASSSAAALHLISVVDEIQMGRDMQVDVQRALPQVPDPLVGAYVEETAPRTPAVLRIRTASARPMHARPMAFALPGGPVWINRGILEIADDEAHVPECSLTKWPTSPGGNRQGN